MAFVLVQSSGQTHRAGIGDGKGNDCTIRHDRRNCVDGIYSAFLRFVPK
jgi:hypothetical protein